MRFPPFYALNDEAELTPKWYPGPNYISSRSADVILSDVRPIKLKLDALRSINVLLDEFLYNLLKAAGSLTTDKLKTSLIKILPTTLGKEAILEAEIELKAYWERTTASPSAQNAGDTGRDFDLQLSFEVRYLIMSTQCLLIAPGSYCALNVKHTLP